MEEEKEKTQDVPEYVKRYMRAAEDARMGRPRTVHPSDSYARAPYVSMSGMSDRERTAEKARRRAETLDIIARKYAKRGKNESFQ